MIKSTAIEINDRKTGSPRELIGLIRDTALALVHITILRIPTSDFC